MKRHASRLPASGHRFRLRPREFAERCRQHLKSLSPVYVNKKLDQRLFKALLVSLLVSAAFLTFIYGRVEAPGRSPDEGAHFSLVCHLAMNPQYPVHYEQVKNIPRRIEPNHVIHPPLYYFYLAGGMRAIYGETAVQEICSPENKAAFFHALKELRLFSFGFTLAGLAGFGFLLWELVRLHLLRRWLAVMLVIITTFMPVKLYIGGMINNDVLVMAIWPWLTLFAVRYLFRGDTRDFWKTVLMAAVAIAAKATLWILAGGFLIMTGFMFMRRQWFSRRKAPVIEPGEPIWKKRILAGLALFCMALAIWTPLKHWYEYQTPQPKYWQIYEMPVSESKFYRIPPEGLFPRSLESIAKKCASKMIATIVGILRHGESYLPGNPEILLKRFWFAIFLLAAAALLTYRVREDALRNLLIGSFVLLPVVFITLFVAVAYRDYHMQGHFGSQGRYLAGYLELFIMGLFMAAGAPDRRETLRRQARRFILPLAAGILAMISFHPFTVLKVAGVSE